MNHKEKVGMVSLGCPKNLVDTQIMLGLLEDDYQITALPEEADIIIVNTCAFIDDAKEESINTILEMARYKEDKLRLLLVAGCLAQRYKEEIIKFIPEVDLVVGTGNFRQIASIIAGAREKSAQVFCRGFDSFNPDGGKRILTGSQGYAYLKIAEGCSNFCTYCIIPSLRGPYKSRREEDILKEAEYLVSRGIREIILVAQDTTRYGWDLYGEPSLKRLLSKLSRIKGLAWIRILYCYPELVDDDLIDEIAENERVVKYLDLPMQHCSDFILKRMGRPSHRKGMEELIFKLRNRIPGITLRTTFITGFPGERQEDFEDLLMFVKKHRFDMMGIFAYSKEEGTPAAALKPQLRGDVKNRRRDMLMEAQREIMFELNEDKMGRIYEVLVSSVAEDGIFYVGRSQEQAPLIDNLIYFTSEEPLKFGEFAKVKILNTDEYDLIGAVVG